MYAIYGHIYHQYTPNVSIVYIPYMDPMGTESGFVGVQSLFCHPLQKNSNLAFFLVENHHVSEW